MNKDESSNIILSYANDVMQAFPDRAITLLFSIVLISIIGLRIGGWKGVALPVFWSLLEGAFGKLNEKAFKQSFKSEALMFRGTLLSIMVIFVSTLLGAFSIYITQTPYNYGIKEILFLSLVLCTGAHWRMMTRINQTVKDDKNGYNYFIVAASSRVDLNRADKSGIIRAVSNHGIVSLERMLILPSLSYLCAGLWGAFIVSGLTYVLWRLGRDGEGKNSSALAHAILKLFSVITTPITVFLILSSSIFVPFANIARGIKGGIKSDLGYGQGGISLSVTAYALNMILGGPSKDIDGWSIKRPWVGPEKVSANMNVDMIKRVRYLHFIVTILWSFCIVGMLFAYKISFL